MRFAATPTRYDLKRILVIQLRELGDTLMSTPLIRQLARIHPGAEIDVLCQGPNACILKNNQNVTRIETLPRGASAAYFIQLAARLRRRPYEMVVDAQSLAKTAILTLLTGARRRLGYRRRWRHWMYTHPFRITATEYSLIDKLRLLQDDRVDLNDLTIDFSIDSQAKQEADTFRRCWFRPPVVAIYGVGQYPWRIWPAAKFAEIADRLARCGYQPYLVYGPTERQAARRISELMHYPALIDYPQISFPALKETIASCEFMVANDGGPKHLATAAETPCVTLFTTDYMATLWNPPGRADMRVVTTRSVVKPQAVVGTFTDAATLADIEVDAVWAEIEQLKNEGFVKKRPCVA